MSNADEDVVVVPARAGTMITGRDWFYLILCLLLIVLFRDSFLLPALLIWLFVQMALWTFALSRTRGHALRLSPAGFERVAPGYRIRVPWDDVHHLERAGGWGDRFWLMHHADHELEPVEGAAEVPPKVLARAQKFGLEHQTALAMFTKDPGAGPVGDHLRRYAGSVLAEMEREKRSR